MKFLLFSDLHHMPGFFMDGTYEDLKLFEKRALEENCDFIIHAGDLTHGPTKDPAFVEFYNNLKVPTYNCLGNHDADESSFEDVVRIYNMPKEYYYFDCKGYRFIVMNPNYYLAENGEYVNFSLANYFGKSRDHIPPDQLKWLEETLDSATTPCIIISHQSFERPDGVKNRKKVLDIINAANKKRPHTVLMCINGHYHRDYVRILDGVCYLDFNSATFEALGKDHTCYPETNGKPLFYIAFNDPLHAIVTLEGTTIDIEGMESSFYRDIDNKASGNNVNDAAGRPCTPRVQSLHITL